MLYFHCIQHLDKVFLVFVVYVVKIVPRHIHRHGATAAIPAVTVYICANVLELSPKANVIIHIQIMRFTCGSVRVWQAYDHKRVIAPAGTAESGISRAAGNRMVYRASPETS